MMSHKQENSLTLHWMDNSRFARYWHHYFHAMVWYHKHMSAYYNTSTFLAQYHIPNQPIAHHSIVLHSKLQPTKSQNIADKRNVRRGYRKHKHWRRYYISDNDKTMECSDTDGEIKMEISEDMINFFTVSENHRRQREAMKETVTGKCFNHKNIVDCGKKLGTVKPPTMRPGVTRSVEMRMLYGDDVPMIHGIETALQMSFDRIYDVYKPNMWPDVPLNIIFI